MKFFNYVKTSPFVLKFGINVGNTMEVPNTKENVNIDDHLINYAWFIKTSPFVRTYRLGGLREETPWWRLQNQGIGYTGGTLWWYTLCHHLKSNEKCATKVYHQSFPQIRNDLKHFALVTSWINIHFALVTSWINIHFALIAHRKDRRALKF